MYSMAVALGINRMQLLRLASSEYSAGANMYAIINNRSYFHTSQALLLTVSSEDVELRNMCATQVPIGACRNRICSSCEQGATEVCRCVVKQVLKHRLRSAQHFD